MHLRGRAPLVAALVGLVAATLAVLTPAGTPGAAAAGEPRPNVVVVMADDMRFDDLQFTPYLRRLARRGTTFDNAFSNFPLCCPARASYWTGQLAHNHGVHWHHVPYAYGAFDDSRTLATSLSAAGYRTGFIGKYLNRYGTDRSLVTGEPSATYVPDGWTDWYGAVDGVRLPGISGGTHQYFDTTMNINGALRQHPGVYQTHLFGLYARTLMRRYAARPAPFFLNVHFVAPHAGGPREPDDPLLTDAAGRRHRLRTPARPASVRGSFDRLVDRAQGRPRGGGPSERDLADKPGLLRRLAEPTETGWRAGRELTRQRAEALRVLDAEVRRTVAALKDAGEWDETVLVVTSDNGYFLGEHRKLIGKVHGYEPSLRVPLVMTGPGVPRGEHRAEPASTVDLSATVLDLAGARPPRRPDGRSLLPVLAGGSRGWRTAVPIESAMRVRLSGSAFPHDDPRFSVGVRTARYTYIRYVGGFEELYDLARDPHQLESVVGDRGYRDERRALRRVWEEVADCAGAGCRVRLPDSLATGPERTHALTRDWLAAQRRRHAFS